MNYLLQHPVTGIMRSEKFVTAIHWRNGLPITDEPEKLGGKDIGPDPYTLLLSALVSCTLATLRMYINHKNLNIAGISVKANMFQNIANGGTVTHFERLIIIPGLADADLQQRLMRIAENCPVSKILKGDIRIISAFSSTGTETPPSKTDLNIN